jgi:hypothetical protein
MERSYENYVQKVKKAKEIIGDLENELFEVRKKLQNNRNDVNLLQELRRTTLNMSSTVNELEYYQSVLDKRNYLISTINENKYY